MSTETMGIARVVERCAWCGSKLGPHMRVVIAGGRFADWSPRIETLRGHIVRVRTSGRRRTVRGIVPLRDTPANHAGYDLLFVLCDIECRDALDRAIGDAPMRLSIADTAESPDISRGRAVKARAVHGRAP